MNPENLESSQPENAPIEEIQPAQPEIPNTSDPVSQDKDNSKTVLEKTEQSIRILSNLWEKRFEILDQYYKERNKKRFIPFKSADSIQSDIQGLLVQLAPINEREEKLIGILEGGATTGLEMLSKVPPLAESSVETTDEAITEFNNKIKLIQQILQRYSELVSSHKDILKIEKELIESPDEAKFNLYLQRMNYFNSEFAYINQKDVDGLKKYFGEIESDLQKIEEARKQNIPLDHLQRSLVSAVVRVAVSNIVAGVIVGSPFTNPLFWALTAATVPSVLMVNYMDYYFKIFTKLTDKLNQLLKLKK